MLKRKASHPAGILFNAYFAKYGNKEVMLFSDQDYPNEGMYDIFCMDLNYINIIGRDSSGFEREMQAFHDSYYLEDDIKEYQDIIDTPEKFLNAKKQLIKLMKKGL